MVSPEVFIKTHMPFDYLWQLLEYPVTNTEFYLRKTGQDRSKRRFFYRDTIIFYEKQSETEQLQSSAYRINRNGVNNSLVFDRLAHIRQDIENKRQSTIVNLYNSAVVEYETAINTYNDFIDYRNRQFSPPKPNAEIRSKIDSVKMLLDTAKNKLNRIVNPDSSISVQIRKFRKSIGDAVKLLEEQDSWLKVFFSKPKKNRKEMFYIKEY